MSKLFCCGSSGCHVIEINEESRRYANTMRILWAQEQKHKHGNYPSEKEQNAYFTRAYNRKNNLKLTSR